MKIILTGFLRPTSATPRDHGDSTSGRHDADENNGGRVDDVTDVDIIVDVASC